MFHHATPFGVQCVREERAKAPSLHGDASTRSDALRFESRYPPEAAFRRYSRDVNTGADAGTDCLIHGAGFTPRAGVDVSPAKPDCVQDGCAFAQGSI